MCVCVCVCTCVHACGCVHVDVCNVCVCTYVCMYVCMYVCTYVCICKCLRQGAVLNCICVWLLEYIPPPPSVPLLGCLKINNCKQVPCQDLNWLEWKVNCRRQPERRCVHALCVYMYVHM